MIEWMTTACRLPLHPHTLVNYRQYNVTLQRKHNQYNVATSIVVWHAFACDTAVIPLWKDDCSGARFSKVPKSNLGLIFS